MLFTSDSDNDTVPRVEGYDDMVPALEGRTVSFSCPSGFVLNGPDSATCTGNREWEPDPRGIMCNNINLEGQCIVMNKIIGNPIILYVVSHTHNIISLSYGRCR
jgi:hypothetical protein